MQDGEGSSAAAAGDTPTCPQTALAMALHRVYNKKLQDKDRQLAQAQNQNKTLQAMLDEANKQIAMLKKQLFVNDENRPPLGLIDGNRKCSVSKPSEGSVASAAKALHTLKGELQELRRMTNEMRASMNLVHDYQTERMQRLVEKQIAHTQLQDSRLKHLNNKLIDLQGHIRVFVRIRPNFRDQTATVSSLDETTLLLNDGKSMSFDRVFSDEAMQLDVWEELHPLVLSCCQGYNVSFLSYGQTGSGKTHTMMGHGAEHPGMTQLAVKAIFAEISKRCGVYKDMTVQLQIIEIYNENIRDLLSQQEVTSLKIRQDPDGNRSVSGAQSILVNNPDQLTGICKTALASRQTRATSMNAQSSRSHCMFIIRLESQGRLHSTLTLTDLCGSERVSRSEVTGQQLKEAGFINKSLSALGNVINALYRNNGVSKSGSKASAHVPYRDSVLTHLLQDSLGGSGRTVMLCHISPDQADLSETQCTLTFAQRVQKVEIIDGRASALVKSQRLQINDLLSTNQALSAELEAVRKKPALPSPPKPPVKESRTIGTAMSPPASRDSSPMRTPSTPPRKPAPAPCTTAQRRKVRVNRPAIKLRRLNVDCIVDSSSRLSDKTISHAARIRPSKRDKDTSRSLSSWRF